MTAERGGTGGRARTRICASMEPRSDDRGELLAIQEEHTVTLGFNGAAVG